MVVIYNFASFFEQYTKTPVAVRCCITSELFLCAPGPKM